jgi:protein gp37
MSGKTTIEWANKSWNAVRGCTKVSPGCKNCYAETFAERFRGVPGHPYERGFDLRLVPEDLYDPFDWAVPCRVFVNSMSDMCHDGVPDWYLRRVADVMEAAYWHSYMVLTKRPERLLQLLTGPLGTAAPRENILWGVSVENRKHGLPRIDLLRRCPARHRFLSIEPLLEDLEELDLTGIGWVIVGGESGPGWRPMEAAWARSIRDQCAAAGVPFFFKQWGGFRPHSRGRELDGVEHNAFPTALGAPIERVARDHWHRSVRLKHGAPSGRRVPLPRLEEYPFGC